MNRHLISAADLSRDDALLILDTAEELAQMAERPVKRRDRFLERLPVTGARHDHRVGCAKVARGEFRECRNN